MFNKPILKLILPVVIIFVLFFGSSSVILAQTIQTTDWESINTEIEGNVQNEKNWLKDSLMWLQNFSWKKAGSVDFWSAVKSALNQIAYDTATWIGSGGKGQKPMFITEGWGEYLKNIGDNAAGTFLESLGNENGWKKFNLCNPSSDIRIKIGLGLVDDYRPKKPSCTFSKMKENWSQALKSDNFLTNLQNAFDPTESTLIQALSIHTSFWGTLDLKKEVDGLDRIENEGWLDISGIAGTRENPPGHAKSKLEQAKRIREASFSENTEDAFEDAINIFLNKLAVELFNRLLESLGKGSKYSGSYNWSGLNIGSLSDFYSENDSGGVVAAKVKFKKLVEPSFNVRGDYNILAELAMCPDPNKAGPTNCVISEEFKTAVENNMTVGEAIRAGYLDPSGIFGFNANGIEPLYNEGYPYRSMVILRKFRILPVGWELAAQFIKDNQQITGGAQNLEYLVNCFDPNDDYGNISPVWCRGFVDPNWVLKAPLNYCERSGPGPEILYQTIVGQGGDSSLVVSRNDDYCADEKTCIKEENGICRLYGYCTEEKRTWNFGNNSCQPEFNTCQAFQFYQGNTFGYLENTLEYGTCSIDNVGCREYCEDYDYTNSNYTCNVSAGNKIYLDRDAEVCDKDSDGCSEFIRTKPVAKANLLYDSSFETNFGISGLPVVNRLCDGDMVDGVCSLQLTGDVAPGVVPIFDSSNIPLQGEAFTFSIYAKNCGDAGRILIGGDVNWSLNHSSTTLSTSDTWQRFSVSHLMIPGTNEVWVGIEDIIDNGNCAGNDCCRIDSAKIERGEGASPYSDYREEGLIYMKLLPDYLENECYVNPGMDYSLKTNYPEVCDNYNRKCNEEEWGCDLYTSIKNKLSVPAITKAMDYCTEECLGYDEYLQMESLFESKNLQYFIPKTARKCSAGAEGCSEFTNLDTIQEGGENREYYKHLRRCIRPNDPFANCSEFYTWEGSSETGFQLKVHVLQVDEDADDVVGVDGMYTGDPDVIEGDQLVCNQAIYNLPATDPGYNEDCLEYYNTAGEVSYHVNSNTISCTENCHPYRKTDNNVVRDPVSNNHYTQIQCENLSKYPGTWIDISRNFYLDADPTNDQCVFCKADGVWSNEHGKCLYMAIPNEGIKCSASQSGCREYSGSEGNNVRIVANDDFEGSLNNWEGFGGSSVLVDSESLIVGGESLKVTGGSIKKTINAWNNRSYMLTFLAKEDTSTGNEAQNFTSVRFDNVSLFAPLPTVINAGWSLYKFNLDIATSAKELIIVADGDFFIDNIRLTEISDRYFLIKDSWNTPNSCYNDIFGNYRGPTFNLGCDAYTDKAGDVHFLHSFSELCQESAVGCELMIDTHNYSSFEAGIWNDQNSDGFCTVIDGQDCEYIEGDSLIYAVYNEDHECNNDEKGCLRIGDPYFYAGDVVYTDKYLENNPDQYTNILCNEDGSGCDEWLTGKGISYFKYPEDQVCEWRQEGINGINVWDWYKKKIKRCDDGAGTGVVNGKIDVGGAGLPEEASICLRNSNCDDNGFACTENKDCRMQACVAGVCSATREACINNDQCPILGSCENNLCHYSCIQDTNNYDCVLDIDSGVPGKTLGHGGGNEKVGQPTNSLDGNWVGLCPVSDSGCTEYIDPISRESINAVFNGDFSQDINGDSLADGFNGAGQQELTLKPSTPYILSIESNSLSVTASLNSTNNDLVPFNETNNRFLNATPNISVVNVIGERNSILFYTSEGLNDTVTLTLSSIATGNNTKVGIRKALVKYSLEQGLDKTSCNGGVSFEQGCVLFNERKVTGGNGLGSFSYKSLGYDADNSPNLSNGPEDCPLGGCDSNVILKVAPDRVCDQWLACKSYIHDKNGNPECFDIGLCNSVNDNGFCNSFINEEDNTLQVIGLGNPIDKYQNVSGYVKVGMSSASEEGMKGTYKFNNMTQEGSTTLVPNGSFEDIGNNKYPIAWVMKDNTGGSVSWGDQMMRVIDNPAEMQNEGISHVPEGRNFLKLGSIYKAVSENIDVVSGAEYFVSGHINTLKLSGGTAKIKVIGGLGNNEILVNNGLDWTFGMRKFTALGNLLSIELYAELPGGGEPVGNFFFDSIRLTPALKIRDTSYVSKSCRLYPQSDSMSCEYITDSGAREKGWYGYCLEYDSFPGSENTCLQWWPVDRVEGEGIEGDYGYLDSFPLYYCQEAYTNRPVERRRLRNASSDIVWGECNSGCLNTEYNCPIGYRRRLELIDPGQCPSDGKKFIIWTIDEGTPGYNSQCTPTCVADGARYLTTEDGQYGWYDYLNGIMDATEVVVYGDITIMIPAENGVRFFNPTTNVITDDIADCLQVTQVVTPSGQNKYWSGRVYENSNYFVNGVGAMADLGYSYDTPNSPFGSMMPPEPLSNPYEWSRSTQRPVPVSIPPNSDRANAGYPYSLSGGVVFPGSIYGICSGSRTMCISPATPGSKYDCKFGEVCNSFPNQSPLNAIDNLKRLYAKNYGTWVWDENLDRYILRAFASVTQGNCSISGLPCNFNECGVQNCTFDTTRSTCNGGTASGAECTNNCVGVGCGISFTIPLFACSDNPNMNCCAGASQAVATCGVGEDCLLTYGGTFRCEFSGNYCNPVSPGNGFVCTGGANIGDIVPQASCSAGFCNPLGTSRTYNVNACDIAAPAPNAFLQRCCPGGNCIPENIYTCGALSLALGGQQCFQCPDGGHCVIQNNPGAQNNLWGPPGTNGEPNNGLCVGGVRNIDDYCAILPVINNNNIKVNGENVALTIQEEFKFVNLTFNSDVDENQLPMVMYAVDWGDGSATNISGAEMIEKPNADNPHSLYHLYDYWNMKNKLPSCGGGLVVNCCFSDHCVIQPRIKIKDNWGWCNHGVNINDCSHWDFRPIITIYE